MSNTKKYKKSRPGRKTLLSLAVVGSAVGIIIIVIVASNYSSFYANNFYYGNVKIGGSTLSHEIDSDIYLLVIASVLVASSLFLLFRVLRNKRGY
ncbi:hypothetical protein M1558_03880 [Candidatus Parvarchaeota archaeon]|nr:hypothetical protein [Candidatus Parvarchaeota archaeon]